MQFRNFELDGFQVAAIQEIDKGSSVIVAAPTGSGKTLIADYAISKIFGSGRRIIYTAPIKALSNQKYSDFSKEYGDENVGIMTGDRSINPKADIMVMTTEVYRNMLLTKDPSIERVGFVVFDEIHYINDIERGTVWEESIIFSPDDVRFVCLSATIPNAQELAAWMEDIKKHKVACIIHDKRAVELKLNFFDVDLGRCTLDDLADVIDIPDYRYVVGRGRRRRSFSASPEIGPVIEDLRNEDMLPCIYFLFSRQDCEKKAAQLASKHAFEKVVLPNLPSNVRTLPSTVRLQEYCTKGIAYHHAGMLPATKHMVEELFAAGKIKVLFATETFAVGVNMPARTVVLDGLRKFDGRQRRALFPREFAQLSGRAGRRGIDRIGYVQILVERRFFDVHTARRVTGADNHHIKSQFRLSINTTLNLLSHYEPDDLPRIFAQTLWSYQEGKALSVIRRQFANLMDRLREGGYVDNDALTQKGSFAARIYCDELVITEIFWSECDLDEYQILLVMAALSYEGRESDKFFPEREDIRSIKLTRTLIQFRKKEKKLESIHDLSALMNPVRNGGSFGRLLHKSNLSEGDLVRLFGQIVDRIGQVKRAKPEDGTRQKLNGCLDLIDGCLDGIDVQ